MCAAAVTTVDMDGIAVATGYLKRPVDAPWHITTTGVAGDERAVHPDALYAYASSHYDYWASDLGAVRDDWAPGTFGENLLFDTLDEGALRLGDEILIGNEVRLVVAGPRVPCFKLAWRLGQPKSFQARFAASGRTGVYLGILAPGIIRPGDRASVVRHEPAAPSVRDLAGYCGAHATPPLDALRFALGQDCLSPTVRMVLAAKQARAQEAEALSRGYWTGWRPFTVAAVRQESADVRSVMLAHVDEGPLPLYQAGMHVEVGLPADAGEIRRVWSLSDHLGATAHWRITVKRQEGEGSRHVHDRLAEGDIVRLRAPAGQFTLDTGTFRPVVLIAAGIGITPLLAMLKAHLARGAAAPPIYLVYGARRPADHIFRDEIQALADRHPDLHVSWFASGSWPDDRSSEDVRRGRIDAASIKAMLAGNYLSIGGQRHAMAWHEVDMYLCGPHTFCEDLARSLATEGANSARIHWECFSGPSLSEPLLSEAVVQFVRSGLAARWSAADNPSLLELAENLGIEAPHSCRVGSCLSCAAKVLAGKADRQLDDGRALLCIARPGSPHIDLDM